MKIVVNRIIFFSLLSVFLFVSCQSESSKNDKQRTLPYLGFKDIEMSKVDGNTVTDTIYHSIGKFYFTSHDSLPITNETVKGKIYVADFFFTHCPSICPVMTNNLKIFHENTKDIQELLIISHTIDPDRDSLSRLREYIDMHEIDTRDDWFFVRGSQSYTYDIGKDQYMINADVDREAEGGFLHSEHFVLVDREGHVRGMYEGTDMTQVDQLEKDIRLLIETEYDNR